MTNDQWYPHPLYTAMNEPSPPMDLILTLRWIETLLARDSEVLRAAVEDDDFSGELVNLHRKVEQRLFPEAEAALEVILERFAVVQAIAFRRRDTP